jgi:hypothetical protein
MRVLTRSRVGRECDVITFRPLAISESLGRESDDESMIWCLCVSGSATFSSRVWDNCRFLGCERVSSMRVASTHVLVTQRKLTCL